MQVILRSVTVEEFVGFGLRGFIDVEAEGQGRLYSFRLPTTEEPDPPGWSSIGQLARVTSGDVVSAWNDTHTANAIAEAAALDVTHRFQGERFVADEVANGLGEPVSLTLTPMDPDIAVPRAFGPGQVVPLPIAPVRFGLPFHISLTPTIAGEPTFLVIHIAEVDEQHWPRFRVPDSTDRTPDSWWFVATFTGISHERIANGWGKDDKNVVLADAVRLLGLAIDGHPVPVRADGTIDVTAWRRSLVRMRLSLGMKPFVFLGRPDHNTAHTRAIIYDAAGDHLFISGAEPGTPSGVPAIVRDSYGKVMLQHLDDPDLLRGVLNRYIRFARSGRPPKPANPPKELLADLIKLPERTWPHIKGVVRIPTMRSDGSILATPGYDPASQLWYAPEFELEPIPERPSLRDLQEAKALILTPLAEFPFVEGSGAQAATIAALFEQIMRPMIQGPRPLYIFDAPEGGQGSGKTLLAKVIQGVITGAEPSITALGKREDEIEKRVTTLLRQQQPFIILDNLTTDVKSEALQQLATSERWQARLLNTNEAPIYPQTATWVLTLNAAKMNRDIARRVVLVRLDAKTKDAWKRTGWKIEDVFNWARTRRASVIRAVLILARNWVLAKCPKDPEVVRGSFEAWCRVMGGVLKYSGFDGLPHALEAVEARDINSEDARLLIKCWSLTFAVGVPIPAWTVAELAKNNGLYEDAFGKSGAHMAIGKAMSKVLTGQRLIGQVIDGLRIDIHPKLINGFSTYVLHTEDTPVPLLSPAVESRRPHLAVVPPREA